jgi:hypothetical protein
MALSPARDVLLFFQDYDRDTFFKNDRHLRRPVRRFYQRLRQGRPKVTGFEVWFQLLKKGLERIGRRVHVNAYRLARKNPHFPVGICGYPHILGDWPLPNPAVVGPGMIDHPAVAPDLMADPRFRLYVTPCDWYHKMFEPVYGSDRCARWHAGIDLDEWPDLSGHPKEVDLLVYDKIRWDREHYEATLLTLLHDTLRAKNLRFEVIRYGHYNHEGYKNLLARSKAMIFLCEHETQGMAYQEAMASNVPILAWDPGIWIDPQAKRYDPNPIPACSVPFFDERCGERFADAAGFVAALDRFWARRSGYAPRAFVRNELSLDESGRIYCDHLAKAAATAEK